MCENSLKPQNNEEENECSDNLEMEMNEEDMTPEEFESLDKQLDALNSALDNIEQKNDDIHAQLMILLESNREIRKQMRKSQ